MSIPYLVFLAGYAVVLLGVFWLSVFNIYHAVRYGMSTVTTTIMSVMYVAFIVVVVGLTAILLRNVDWTSSFSLNVPLPTSLPSLPTP